MIYFHVGVAKAGSTTLQRHYFNRINFYFGNYSDFYKKKNFKDIYVENIIENIRFNKKIIDENYLKEIDQCFISDEGISNGSDNEIRNNLSRLNSLFKKEKKILIIIREQKSLFISKYYQAIKKENISIAEFAKKYLENKDYEMTFNYYKLYKLYEGYFGKNNVCLIPFELFIQNRQVFLNKLLKFLNLSNIEIFNNIDSDQIDIERLYHTHNPYKKFTNLFSKKFKNYVRSYIDKKFLYKILTINRKNNLNSQISKQISLISSISNEKLSLELDLDLKKFGYD